MKKILALALALCMVFALAACGQSAAPAPAATEAPAAPAESAAPAAAESSVKVAMITDYGDITDQSFNQTTYEACKAYCDENGLSFTYFKPASDSDEDRVSMIEKAIDEGYNVVVMPGYAFAPAIAATAPQYADVSFIALDVSEYDLTSAGLETIPANLYSAVYQEELCGYMAGYAAVKLGYTKLGFLGGMAVPAVVRYGYGFVQGADAAAAETGAEVSMNYAYGNQFYGDADITAAMDTWYGAGTQVVFACGGGIYSSAAEAAAKTGGKVIGVDVDQSGTIDGQYGAGMTVTSAMKGLAPTVKTMLAAVQSGSFASMAGKVENLGLVSANPDDNYVQLPSATTQFGDGFTAEDYANLVADMFAGKITVSNDTSIAAADNAKVITVNDQGNLK
ncbi:MAG: BMP family ABC transporter substrate-binding protein [Oscillospiraceae bacterium]|jgi:basic membrane protein A|nr:BMP family ABC transporter substrate-binding protein [Oscillospiraceae bacterium]